MKDAFFGSRFSVALLSSLADLAIETQTRANASNERCGPQFLPQQSWDSSNK